MQLVVLVERGLLQVLLHLLRRQGQVVVQHPEQAVVERGLVVVVLHQGAAAVRVVVVAHRVVLPTVKVGQVVNNDRLFSVILATHHLQGGLVVVLVVRPVHRVRLVQRLDVTRV
jgi:cell division FtsZ-interacting protein ZapD